MITRVSFIFVSFGRLKTTSCKHWEHIPQSLSHTDWNHYISVNQCQASMEWVIYYVITHSLTLNTSDICTGMMPKHVILFCYFLQLPNHRMENKALCICMRAPYLHCITLTWCYPRHHQVCLVLKAEQRQLSWTNFRISVQCVAVKTRPIVSQIFT